MEPIRTFFRRIAPLVLAAFGWVSLYVPAAHAGMVAPSAYVGADQQATDAHQQLQAFLARDDVRAQLVELGVDPAAAQARVDALSADEAVAAAARIQDMPAGGDSIIGALVFIFLVLLVTDLLGLTDVFPFVNKR